MKYLSNVNLCKIGIEAEETLRRLEPGSAKSISATLSSALLDKPTPPSTTPTTTEDALTRSCIELTSLIAPFNLSPSSLPFPPLPSKLPRTPALPEDTLLALSIHAVLPLSVYNNFVRSSPVYEELDPSAEERLPEVKWDEIGKIEEMGEEYFEALEGVREFVGGGKEEGEGERILGKMNGGGKGGEADGKNVSSEVMDRRGVAAGGVGGDVNEESVERRGDMSKVDGVGDGENGGVRDGSGEYFEETGEMMNVLGKRVEGLLDEKQGMWRDR
ncbi:hypothetical protein HDV00_011419 [Rhizophlyctis rosea]|nr:hypothetical protein HDV00_011419 [Rhizophlyctis rosea]